jgi:hypothetical protein
MFCVGTQTVTTAFLLENLSLIRNVCVCFSKVSCSRGHVLVLLASGECWRYSIKSDSWRRIDHFIRVERELTHKDIGIDPIVRVCCGVTFDVALSKSGETVSQGKHVCYWT